MFSLRHPGERPAGVLGEQLVVPGRMALDRGSFGRTASVSYSDERVALEPASVVLRHVEAFVARAQVPAVLLEPVHQRHRRLPGGRGSSPPLDAAGPRTDGLADG